MKNERTEGKYMLIGFFDGEGGEFDAPVVYNTHKEARQAIKDALIDAMGGEGGKDGGGGSDADDSIFANFEKEVDYYWEENGDCAWFKCRRGNSDWVIIPISEIAGLHKKEVENFES